MISPVCQPYVLDHRVPDGSLKPKNGTSCGGPWQTVNSRGSIQREQAVGSGRTDLIVTWPLGDKEVTLQRAQNKQIVVLELKLIYRNDGADTVVGKGVQQTAGYMQRFAASEGHLLLFDRRKDKSWDERIWVKQEQSAAGKAIIVWGL